MVRVAVNSGRRRKDNLFNAIRHECTHKCDRARNVVVVVTQRLFHRLTDCFVCSEVDDFGNIKLATNFVDDLCIADIALDEWNISNSTFVTKLE